MSHSSKDAYLLFRIANQLYALPVEDVEEILPMAALERPPAAPGVLLGFLELGSSTIGVISLRRLFELPEKQPEFHTPLILLKDSQPPLALCVDAVSEIVRLESESILPVGESCSINDCLQGILKLATGRALLLASERLLLREERARLHELSTVTRQRVEEINGAVQ